MTVDDSLSSLVVDYQDSDVLPSFTSIRQNTLETLYDFQQDADNSNTNMKTKKDKSPKGSVDEGIRDLVDLINHHPSFATLSSCSGRISLFDPNNSNTVTTTTTTNEETVLEDDAEATHHNNNNINNNNNNNNNGGKGGTGGWLLVSHDEIQADALIRVLRRSSNIKKHGNDEATTNTTTNTNATPLTLNLEPMLLHVAAANLTRGQQLLQVALRLGFRESGLVVTAQRVTVAIRSYALALSVPLVLGLSNQEEDDIDDDRDGNNSSTGALHLTDSYVTAFCALANQRLRQNAARIQQLYQGFAQQFFFGQGPCKIEILAATVSTAQEQQPRPQQLPGLFLWGHAAVAVRKRTRQTQQETTVEIWAMGGYGPGPKNGSANGSNTGTSSRSNKVYRLGQCRHDGGRMEWEPEWEEMIPPPDDSLTGMDQVVCCGDLIATRPSQFAPREGLKAIEWTNGDEDDNVDGDSPIILLFGGRQSPAKPLDDLLLYHCNLGRFLQPADVRGTPPSPRWGHSLTRMTGSIGEDRKCVVFGGRDETTTFSDGYVLLQVQSDNNDSRQGGIAASHFLWTKLDFSNSSAVPRPKFHHSCCAVNDNCVLIMGGLDADNTLLGTRNVDEVPLQEQLDAQLIRIDNANQACVLPVDSGEMQPMFGQELWNFPLQRGGDTVFLATGGLSLEQKVEAGQSMVDDDSVQCFSLEQSKEQHYRLKREDAIVVGKLDLSSLVHHTCVVIPSTEKSKNEQQVAVVGGGVQGFAFGPHFAPSTLLTARVSSGDKIDAALKSVWDHSSTSNANAHGHARSAGLQSTSNTMEPYVVYVIKRKAHKLRSCLEAQGWLDRRYRMTPADESLDKNPLLKNPTDYIAVPILSHAYQLLHDKKSTMPLQQHSEWWALMQAFGQRTMPLSTATFAAKRKS